MSVGPEPLGVFGYPQPGATAAPSLRQDEDTNMKASSMLESKYLKQSDVDGEVLVTVRGVKRVNVARDDEEPEYRWTVKFQEFEKPMVLNATNIKRMAKALGDDTDDWIGGNVLLYVDPDIEFGGNVVGGLRIKAARQKLSKSGASIDEINRKFQDAVDESEKEIPF